MRTTEPTTITQGERIEWSRCFADYPASLYSLEYRFRGNGTGFNVTATADGDDFASAITATQSAACSVTRYQWQAWLTEIADATNTFAVDQGSVNVERGFATGTTTAVDLRSPAKIMLDAIDAALLALNTENVQEYEISTPSGTRKVKRSDRAGLLADRKYWAGIVANERAKERSKNGQGFGTQVLVRMP